MVMQHSWFQPDHPTELIKEQRPRIYKSIRIYLFTYLLVSIYCLLFSAYCLVFFAYFLVFSDLSFFMQFHFLLQMQKQKQDLQGSTQVDVNGCIKNILVRYLYLLVVSYFILNDHISIPMPLSFQSTIAQISVI